MGRCLGSEGIDRTDQTDPSDRSDLLGHRAFGIYPIDVWIAWVQEQPAEVSGARRRPPAGIMDSQQPERMPMNWERLSVARSHMPWKW